MPPARAEPVSSERMDDATGPRPLPSLAAVGAGVGLFAALWLVPDLTPSDAVAVVGQESLHARIAEELPPDAMPLSARFVLEHLGT